MWKIIVYLIILAIIYYAVRFIIKLWTTPDPVEKPLDWTDDIDKLSESLQNEAESLEQQLNKKKNTNE